ncbi:hypothetical protein I3843_03G231300 [Carya illinoinensis]|nr:hypothetical protein I3843_03G231300 [Carya illinoinensis]
MLFLQRNLEKSVPSRHQQGPNPDVIYTIAAKANYQVISHSKINIPLFLLTYRVDSVISYTILHDSFTNIDPSM